MHQFKQLRRTTVTLGAALTLLTPAFPGTAHAATGVFSYHSPESGDLELSNPTDNECRLLLQGADRATNSTNTNAFLYSDRGCEEPHSTMRPGTSRTFHQPNIPRSVMFRR